MVLSSRLILHGGVMAKLFDRIMHRPLRAVPSVITPNHLTVTRAVLVLPVIAFARLGYGWIAVAMLILSSTFDILDGPLARVRGQAGGIGATLDPVADKVFVLGALFFACGEEVPLRTKLIVLSLEIALTCARPIKAKFGLAADANQVGALKTWVQSFAIAFVLTRHPFFLSLAPIAFIAAISLAVLSLAWHVSDILRGSSRSNAT
jgi:CDP-diacylglycerol--glycerol-3-phosphate 3-phosphatidyltransferase